MGAIRRQEAQRGDAPSIKRVAPFVGADGSSLSLGGSNMPEHGEGSVGSASCRDPVLATIGGLTLASDARVR